MPICGGRQFSDTPVGTQASAISYTMVEMAKANDVNVNVYHYLSFLFEHQPNEKTTDEEFEKFAPLWNELVKAEIQKQVERQLEEE